MAKNNVRLPDWFVPEHYALTLEPDLKRHAFSGTVEIKYRLKKSSKVVTLHALELAFQSVTVETRRGILSATAAFDIKRETVTLTFSAVLPTGVGVMRIAYTGTLNDKMHGFYRSQYEVHGKDEVMAVTQFESTFARYALPSVDEPAAKATFEVTLIVEPGLTTISNTIETGVEKLPDGRNRVTYARTPKMSTYLLAFIVGRFGHVERKSKHGTLTRVFAPKGKEHQATFALDVAVKCLDFYEDYFGIHNPLPVVDHIAIPDFSAGAMENWGAITYRETALLFDTAESSAQNKQRIALVIAHELAHQWFGNLVTMEWWTDLWLNEGFANYIEYLAIDHLFPEWDVWTQFVDMDANEAMRLDALESTHPIEVEVGHPSEINEIFDAVSYAKGATVIRMLAEYVGHAAFRKGLRAYLKRHAYGNARTADLWAALERASGKPVRRVMKSWTKQGGYPVVAFSRVGGTLHLSQSRYFSEPMRTSKERWSIPLTLGTPKRQSVLLENRSIKVPIPPASLWVNANAAAVGMYRTHYDTPSLAALTAAISAGALSPAEKIRLVNDVCALAFSAHGSTTDALSLLAAFAGETSYPVWSAVCGELAALLSLLEGTPAEARLKRFVIALLTPIAKELDTTAKPHEEHHAALLRGLIYHMLVRVGDEKTISEFVKRFRTHAKGSRLQPDLRPAVYAAFARGGTKSVATLISHYEHEEMHAEKNRLLVALGNVPRRSDLKRALTYAMGKTVRFQDTRWVFLSAARSARGAAIVFEVFAQHWDTFIERYGKSGHDLPRYVHCLDTFATAEALLEVKQFFKTHRAPGAERAVKQLVETIRARIAWRKNNLATAEAWLAEWETSLPR